MGNEQRTYLGADSCLQNFAVDGNSNPHSIQKILSIIYYKINTQTNREDL